MSVKTIQPQKLPSVTIDELKKRNEQRTTMTMIKTKKESNNYKDTPKWRCSSYNEHGNKQEGNILSAQS